VAPSISLNESPPAKRSQLPYTRDHRGKSWEETFRLTKARFLGMLTLCLIIRWPGRGLALSLEGPRGSLSSKIIRSLIKRLSPDNLLKVKQIKSPHPKKIKRKIRRRNQTKMSNL